MNSVSRRTILGAVASLGVAAGIGYPIVRLVPSQVAAERRVIERRAATIAFRQKAAGTLRDSLVLVTFDAEYGDDAWDVSGTVRNDSPDVTQTATVALRGRADGQWTYAWIEVGAIDAGSTASFSTEGALDAPPSAGVETALVHWTVN